MTARIAHRGPDGSGSYLDARCGLGHRRLSIIDLSGGAQPMQTGCSGLHITYNGEIFNHAALRRELERAGHRYHSRSDTETILHSYEAHGARCLDRFRGMFAFAIWDEASGRLFAARDRLGIKPFYYFCDGEVFVFASEIKAILEHPAVTARLRRDALGEYLAFGYLSGEETLFAGVRKLQPGHHLTLSTGKGPLDPRIERYWDVPEAAPSCQSADDLAAECRARLEETVRMRLMSDVPLGVFLSGGVDSSAIAALAAREVSSPLHTFSVGYAETQYSELPAARAVAASIGAVHREVSVSRQQFFDALPNLIWHEDEPLTWPSSVSLAFVSRLAATEVKVVLTGEGSDELFGGYSRYRLQQWNERAAALLRHVPAMLSNALRRQIADSPLIPAGLRRKLGHTVFGREDSLESLYLENFCCAFSAEQSRRLIGGEADCFSNFLQTYAEAHARAPLERLLYTDQKTYLVELLMKQDQMSMSASIESRVPFLDHPFVEFAARVPADLKLRDGGKHILKRVLKGLVPEDVLHRKKLGFPTPITSWLRGPAARDVTAMLLRRDGLLASVCCRSEIEKLLDRHERNIEDGTDRIWRLLNLELWGSVFLGMGPLPG